MTSRRWQPPPLEVATPAAQPTPTVDEQVVRKMLKVNPDMRKGRTTQQVKRALERGEAIGGAPAQPATSVLAASDPARELAETLGFFLRGKTEALRRALADIDARRRELVAQEQRERAMRRAEIVAFVHLLDRDAIARHGATALGGHAALLGELGVTPRELLEDVRRSGGAKR
ncbi:MAG: hypothetical protein AAB426_10090 [Myxococcota bacterium]